jgi:hypothetical protein
MAAEAGPFVRRDAPPAPMISTVPATRAELGRDGVTFTSPDGSSRFVPYPAGIHLGGDDAAG